MLQYDDYMDRAEAMAKAAEDAADESMRRSFKTLAEEWRRLAMACLDRPGPASSPAPNQPSRP